MKSLGSGLDKRQATVQLTVHADGKPQTPPMVVFRGKGLRINSQERNRWDKRVVVKFQENAWVNEDISLRWAQSIWRQPTFEPRLLILDVHTAQKTPAFLHALSLRHTIPAFVPPGCTSLVQPLDVALNKPFKNLVDAQYNQHFEANLDAWALGKISASERRILMTRWIGAAWETFCSQYKHVIIASFVKCGIALPIDGSQDTLINIRGLNEYSIPPWQSNPLLTLQHPAKAPPPPESDSECYTEATYSVSGSDCQDSDVDIDTDASVAGGQVEERLEQAEVQDVLDMDMDASVADGQVEDASVADGQAEDASIADGRVEDASVADGQAEDASVADGRVEEGFRQVEVQDMPVVPSKQPRRRLRSHITLGEEIL